MLKKEKHCMNRNNFCIILAGGIGVRLWPISRQSEPKQFVDFLGSGESMLQTTYRRFRKIIDEDNIIVVSNIKYKSLVAKQLPNLKSENLLLEPMRRNTVASATWATICIKQRNPNANIIVAPVDQLITHEGNFADDMTIGLDYVGKHKRLLTIGVVPTRPETAFGYIQMGDEIESDIFKVKSFTEKPESQFARMFLESKEFLWNTGLFLWNVNTFMDAIKKHIPDAIQILTVAQERLENNESMESIIDDMFATSPNLSIEVGLLEKADNVDVMLCHFNWIDIGTWGALYDAQPKDENKNVTTNSKSMMYDCRNCIVQVPKDKIAVIQGLDGYLIAEKDNVLIICKKNDQASIRKFVNDAEINLGEDYV